MIQYDRDGVTLFYVDASGKKFSHNFMEVAAYGDMLNIRDAQLQAIRENTQSVANYETALANCQLNVDAGHTMTVPAKPLMKLVSDTGETTFAPFDPPLKDLRAPTATIPLPAGSGIKRDTSQDDKQAVLYNMVLAIFRKMFPDA